MFLSLNDVEGETVIGPKGLGPPWFASADLD
jgi:hypothetical protein